MKRIILALVLVFCLLAPPWAFSADNSLNKSLTFTWEQPVDLENINGWTLYWSSVSGSGYVKLLDISYILGSGPIFTVSTVMTVTGPPGSKVIKYFVMGSNGKNGLNSLTYSNEAHFLFVMPTTTAPPAAPINLMIKVTVGP